MSCRDIHATNAFAFVIAMLSVGGLAVATLIPQWRTMRLLTFNRNAKNVTVYDGLWTKCVQRDGSSGCYYFDSDWYAKVDQLDLRLLQFCLPAGRCSLVCMDCPNKYHKYFLWIQLILFNFNGLYFYKQYGNSDLFTAKSFYLFTKY